MTHTPTTTPHSPTPIRRGTPATPALLSRSNPPRFRVPTPKMLRYFQVVILTVGLIIGITSIPFFVNGNQFADHAKAEEQYANLSAIQTKTAAANERALTSLLQRKPDADGFQQQMGEVAATVAVAGQGGTVDTQILGKVSSGLIQYTAHVNAALTAEEAAAGSGTADMASAQKTLNDDVWTNLDQLLVASAATSTSVTWVVVLGWIGLSIGLISVIWLAILLARRTKRIVNPGLLISAAFLVTGGVVLAVAPGTITASVDATTTHALVAAEGHIAKMRAAELQFIMDPTNTAARTEVDSRWKQANEAIADANPTATTHLTEYQKGWKTVTTQVSSGKTSEAVTAAIQQTGPAVVKATTATNLTISQTRAVTVETLKSGSPALTWTGVGLAIIGFSVIVSGLAGIQARLREYR